MVESKGSEHGPAQTEPAPDQTATLVEVDALAESKSTKSPAFQFYPKDFLSSSKVRKMTLAEIGAYIVLLSTYWLDGGLPNDHAELAGILRITDTQFGRLWTGRPLGQCFVERNGRLVNERLERERKIQADFRRKQKDKADARWQSHGTATAMPGTGTRHASGNALQSASAIRNLQSASAKHEESREPPSDSPPLVTFTTVGKLKTWVLTQTQLDAWSEAFPHLDIFGECRKAHAWTDANPAKRKTARGMPAFLLRWFEKAVNRGGAAVVAVRPSPVSGNGWECPHVDFCPNQDQCNQKRILGAEKYPLKAVAS